MQLHTARTETERRRNAFENSGKKNKKKCVHSFDDDDDDDNNRVQCDQNCTLFSSNAISCFAHDIARSPNKC